MSTTTGRATGNFPAADADDADDVVAVVVMVAGIGMGGRDDANAVDGDERRWWWGGKVVLDVARFMTEAVLRRAIRRCRFDGGG